MTPESFRIALGIISGRLKGPELFQYYEVFGYRDYNQMYSDGEIRVRERAEGILSSQFEAVCERIWELESKVEDIRSR